MMKKLVALLMALALLCSSIGAFAAEETLPITEGEGTEDSEQATPPTNDDEGTEDSKEATPPTNDNEGTKDSKEATPSTNDDEGADKPEQEQWDVVVGAHYANNEDKTENCKPATCEEEGYDEYKCQDPLCEVKTFQVKIPALGHKAPAGTGSVVTKPATCEGTGIRTWDNCVNCKHSWEEVIGPLGHAWEKKLDAEGKPVVVDPTCTEDGYTVYVCTRCTAEKHDDTVAKLGHKWAVNPHPTTDDELIWSEVDSVTCIDGGKLVKFKYCERCHLKEIVSEDSTYWEPLDHQAFLEEYIKREDKESDVDYADRMLDKVYEDMNDEDLILCKGHQIETTTDKYAAFHHPVKVTIDDATCEEDGLLTLACTKCDAKVEIVLPAYGHSFYFEAVSGSVPTCLEDGKIMVYCDFCDYEKQINVPAPGKHNYSKEPTAYSQVKFFETIDHGKLEDIAECIDYTEHYACQGHSVRIEIAKGVYADYTIGCNAELDKTHAGNDKHDKAEQNYAFRDSTCIEEGYEYFYCNKCGYSYGKTIPMKEHDLKYKVITAPTCTEDGEAHWDCTFCKQTIKVQVLPMTGHNYQVLEGDHKDETCTTDGYDLYTCLYCGDNYKEVIPKHHVAPLPQDINPDKNNNQAYKAPTCTEPGLQSYECLVCHTPIQNEVIPALGHDYSGKLIVDGEKWDKYESATCVHGSYYTRECQRCGHKEKTAETEKLGHLMARKNPTTGAVEVSSLVLLTDNLPTCETTGKAVYNCVVCGKLVEDFVMPALPHNESVVWNEKKRAYEVTCVKAEWDLWDDLMDGYLWDEIISCTEDDEQAEEVYANVMDELYKKLHSKDSKFIPGIGCGKVTEIPVIKTHYTVALKDGVVSLTPDENCVLLKNPMVIVNWSYTLSDDTAFSYTRLLRADDPALSNPTFDLGLAKAPAGSVLESITVIVTDTASLDITVAAKGFGYKQF